MAKGCNKCKETECEECPEWIFTLADLIMCMMGLFVILWVLKPSGNPQKGNASDNQPYVKMAAAIREAFGYTPNPESKDPVDIEMLMQKLSGERLPRGPGEGGKTQLDNEGTEGEDKQVTKIREGKMSSVGSALLFPAGGVLVSADIEKQVKQLAVEVRGHRQIIYVKGHASLDDLPAGANEAAKMELSVARARAVADLLIQNGVAPEVIRVQGCSTFEPARQRRYGNDGQVANRRAEIEVTDQLVEERQDRGR